MDKLSNIKIVFLDIDGTLTNSERKVSLKNKEAIKKIVNKGILVVLVSGRNCPYAVLKSKDSNSSPIVISSNGAGIYDYENNNLIYGDKIPYSKISEIFEFCNSNKIKVIFNSTIDIYANKYMSSYSKDNYKIIKSLSELENIDVIQLTFQIDKFEDISKCRNMIDKLDLKINYLPNGFSDNLLNSIDVNNMKVSKGAAIKYLLKKLNIKKEESLCIGDYINDKDMFNECGVKVAMMNATVDLKEISDYITLSNDEDGVAEFLNKYL